MKMTIAWIVCTLTFLFNVSFSEAVAPAVTLDECVSTDYRLYFLLSTAAFYFLILLFCIFAVILYYCEKSATKSVCVRLEPKLMPEVKKFDERAKQHLPSN